MLKSTTFFPFMKQMKIDTSVFFHFVSDLSLEKKHFKGTAEQLVANTGN
jgi:hypothetical protein